MIRLLIVVFALVPAFSYAQCKSLRKKTSKFDSVVRIHSPYDEAATVIKEVDGNGNRYFLNLTAPGSASADRKGVTLLLDNGQKLEWPDDKVEVKYETYHPRFSGNLVAKAFVPVSEEQMKTLSEHRITDYRLYIFEWTIRERLGKDLQQNIGCLLTATPDAVKE